jgi:hypothetical protein
MSRTGVFRHIDALKVAMTFQSRTDKLRAQRTTLIASLAEGLA